MDIDIRLIRTHAEYLACEEVQSAVWGPFGVVPHHLLSTAQRSGGLVLGAFDRARPSSLLGFVFSFLARAADGRLKHASHMAAVMPGYRDAKIGERLKLAQRTHVLAQGLNLITWTFDPLISRNANLNIAKLGAVCRTYMRNMYGPDPEEPTGELPSDRFQVDWWLDSAHVTARIAGAAAPAATELRAEVPLINPDPQDLLGTLGARRLLFQIPTDVDALKESDMARARAWRYQLRELAEHAFAAGYVVSDYARDSAGGLYVLERGHS